MGVAMPSAALDAAIGRVIAAGRRAGVAVGLFVGDASQVPAWVDRGETVFVSGTDQSQLKHAAQGLRAPVSG